MKLARPRAQALVEFAFALPVFVIVVFMTIQLALLFIAYFSETQMASQTARWLAVTSSATDDYELASQVQATMLPGLVTGTPVTTVGTTSVDASALVGRMTVRYTPCVISGTVCSHTNRVAGSTLYVEMSYDVSNLIFLPTTFRIGSLVTSVPTSLPAYRVYVLVE